MAAVTDRWGPFRREVSFAEARRISGRLGVAIAGAVLTSTMAIGCACPLLSIVAPSPTATPTPTKTPRPSATPTEPPSPTPEPEPTATAMATEAPTQAPIIVPTATLARTPLPPTPTRRAPTATPTRQLASPTPRPPAATPTVAYQYSLHQPVEYLPDCAGTTLEGTVWDIAGVNQIGNVLLKVCVEGEYWCGSVRTGGDPTKGAGYYVAILDPENPKAGQWWVAVVDAQGRPLSPAVRFQTDTKDCEPDGEGRQWVIIDFRKNY